MVYWREMNGDKKNYQMSATARVLERIHPILSILSSWFNETINYLVFQCTFVCLCLQFTFVSHFLHSLLLCPASLCNQVVQVNIYVHWHSNTPKNTFTFSQNTMVLEYIYIVAMWIESCQVDSIRLALSHWVESE